MKAIESIEKVLKYIEKNYHEDITISMLADVGNLSLFYFQRLFKDTVGATVDRYLICRRLAHSCDMLSSNMLIKDVATECGFTSVEHFSRSFKGLYNIAPSEFKSGGITLNHIYVPDVILNESKIALGDKYISNNMVMSINEKVRDEVLVVGFEEYCENTIDKPGESGAANAWKKIHAAKDKMTNIKVPHCEYGISHSFSRKGFKYLAGIEVNDDKEIKEDITSFILPEGKYICCTYESEDFETATNTNMKNVMSYFSSWFRQNNYKSDGKPYAVECYSEDAFKPPYRIEILAKIR